jgi:nucleoside-triphosphatase THEP1
MRILVTGSQGCGKTTFCQKVIESVRLEGGRIGGVLAPAVYFDRYHVGADAIDLASGRSAPITRPALEDDSPRAIDGSRWIMVRQGLDLARQALEWAIRHPCDLIVVDEFGPLELAGGGIREQAIDAWNSGRDVLLVVRSAIADEAISALGRPPDVRLVPEAAPVANVGRGMRACRPVFVHAHRQPALLALARA